MTAALYRQDLCSIKIACWFDTQAIGWTNMLNTFIHNDLQSLGIRPYNVVKVADNDYYTVIFDNKDDLNLYLMVGKIARLWPGKDMYRPVYLD